MKICVLGPVESNLSFGGVSTFTESLSDGFAALGHEVIIITDFSERNQTLNHVRIISLSNKPLRRSLRLPFLVKKGIIKHKPNLVISSLEYGLAIPLIKASLRNFISIHYLHAFPTYKTGPRIKNFFLNTSMRIISKNVDYMIANSSLTAVVNRELFNIKVDTIIPIGIGYEILNGIKDAEKSDSILYVGRLAKEKNVNEFILAIKYLNDVLKIEIPVVIVGDGPMRKSLIKLSNGLNISFVGKLKPNDIIKYYGSCKFFVSLNPHEPFGITYLEALLAKCFLIIPFTGGQLDFINLFAGQYKLVNPYAPKEIALSIKDAIGQSLSYDHTEILKRRFTYEKVAYNILAFLTRNGYNLIEKIIPKESGQ